MSGEIPTYPDEDDPYFTTDAAIVRKAWQRTRDLKELLIREWTRDILVRRQSMVTRASVASLVEQYPLIASWLRELGDKPFGPCDNCGKPAPLKHVGAEPPFRQVCAWGCGL